MFEVLLKGTGGTLAPWKLFITEDKMKEPCAIMGACGFVMEEISEDQRGRSLSFKFVHIFDLYCYAPQASSINLFYHS